LLEDSAVSACSNFAAGGSGIGVDGPNTIECADNIPWYRLCEGGSARLYAAFPCDGAGSWDNTTSYLEHDVVIRSAECYVAKIDNINKDPLTNPDEWAIFG